MKKGHKILLIKRSIVILSTLFIALLSSWILFFSTNVQIVSGEYTILSNVAEAVAHQYNTAVARDSIYQEYNHEALANITGFAAYSISKNGYDKQTVSDLSSELSKLADTYYFRGKVDANNKTINGKLYSVFSYLEECDIDLTESEKYTLLSEGFFKKDDMNYSCVKINNSEYVITSAYFTDFIIQPSIASTYPETFGTTIILVDSNTGLIKDSNVASLIDSPYTDIIPATEADSITDSSAHKITMADGSNAIICSISSSIDDNHIYTFIPTRKLLPIYVRALFVPCILTVLFLVFIMFYMLSFMKPHKENEKERIEYLHFYKNIYSDAKLISHNLGLGMLAIIVVISSTAYVQTLINHSTESINANNNLSTLKSFIATSESNWEETKADMLKTNSYLGDLLADYYLKHPDEINNNDLSAMRDKLPFALDLTIYDQTGTVVADTLNRVGYTLSADEASPENVFQDVLHGSLDSTFYIDDGLFNTLSRRQDKVGLIKYTNYGDYYDEFKNICSIDSDLMSVDFQTSAKGYIAKDNPDIVYWIDPLDDTSSNIRKLSNPLSEEELSNNSIVCRIANSKRLLHLSETNSYYIFSATNISNLNGFYNFIAEIVILISFVLQQLVIFFTNLRQKDEVPKKKISLMSVTFNPNDENMYSNVMDNDFKKLFSSILVSAIIAIVILIIGDQIIENHSLISYIANSQWPKGFNLFSLTMILISTVAAFFLSKLLKYIILFFTQNMGPRGLTIGRMLSSVISFLALIITVILAVVYLGVNYTALLAGAGIAGVALTVCAQSSISDMLSGFLIVFENLFNIGDWLTVGDFRGQVTEIGLRTTKLQISNTVKIYNNSELKNVTVMERNGQGCIVLVDIAYKEDANKVIEFLKNSTERYQNDIPAITEGPFIDGIVDLTSSGVTLYIWAIADLEVIRATEREIRRVTKNIFDENHIEIPFTQITLHEADVERYFTGEDEE